MKTLKPTCFGNKNGRPTIMTEAGLLVIDKKDLFRAMFHILQAMDKKDLDFLKTQIEVILKNRSS